MDGWKEEFVYKVLVKILTRLSSISDEGLTRWSLILGNLWFTLDSKHRQVSLSNLQLTRSTLEKYRGRSLSYAEIYEISRRNFIHLARVFLEVARFQRINSNNVDQFVTCSGDEEVRKALDDGKGVILLTGHFGNWEITAYVAPFLLGTPINILARPLDFAPLEKLITETRCRTGNRVFARKSAGKKVLRSLKDNEIIGILQDQRSSRHDGVIVPLLGRPAITHKGMAILAARTGASVIPVFSHRKPDGRYHIEIHPRVYLINTGDVKKDIVLNTSLFNKVIERQIVKYPDQWFWVHRRWRIVRKRRRRLFRFKKMKK